MANRAATRDDKAAGAAAFTWAAFTEADTPLSTYLPDAKGINGCVAVTGTFGGTSIAIQGSNDDVNYYTLKDLQGNDLVFTSAGLKDFSTACLFLKPVRTGGSSTSVVVTVALR